MWISFGDIYELLQQDSANIKCCQELFGSADNFNRIFQCGLDYLEQKTGDSKRSIMMTGWRPLLSKDLSLLGISSTMADDFVVFAVSQQFDEADMGPFTKLSAANAATGSAELPLCLYDAVFSAYFQERINLLKLIRWRIADGADDVDGSSRSALPPYPKSKWLFRQYLAVYEHERRFLTSIPKMSSSRQYLHNLDKLMAVKSMCLTSMQTEKLLLLDMVLSTGDDCSADVDWILDELLRLAESNSEQILPATQLMHFLCLFKCSSGGTNELGAESISKLLLLPPNSDFLKTLLALWLRSSDLADGADDVVRILGQLAAVLTDSSLPSTAIVGTVDFLSSLPLRIVLNCLDAVFLVYDICIQPSAGLALNSVELIQGKLPVLRVLLVQFPINSRYLLRLLNLLLCLYDDREWSQLLNGLLDLNCFTNTMSWTHFQQIFPNDPYSGSSKTDEIQPHVSVCAYAVNDDFVLPAGTCVIVSDSQADAPGTLLVRWTVTYSAWHFWLASIRTFFSLASSPYSAEEVRLVLNLASEIKWWDNSETFRHLYNLVSTNLSELFKADLLARRLALIGACFRLLSSGILQEVDSLDSVGRLLRSTLFVGEQSLCSELIEHDRACSSSLDFSHSLCTFFLAVVTKANEQNITDLDQSIWLCTFDYLEAMLPYLFDIVKEVTNCQRANELMLDLIHLCRVVFCVERVSIAKALVLLSLKSWLDVLAIASEIYVTVRRQRLHLDNEPLELLLHWLLTLSCRSLSFLSEMKEDCAPSSPELLVSRLTQLFTCNLLPTATSVLVLRALTLMAKLLPRTFVSTLSDRDVLALRKSFNRILSSKFIAAQLKVAVVKLLTLLLSSQTAFIARILSLTDYVRRMDSSNLLVWPKESTDNTVAGSPEPRYEWNLFEILIHSIEPNKQNTELCHPEYLEVVMSFFAQLWWSKSSQQAFSLEQNNLTALFWPAVFYQLRSSSLTLLRMDNEDDGSDLSLLSRQDEAVVRTACSALKLIAIELHRVCSTDGRLVMHEDFRKHLRRFLCGGPKDGPKDGHSDGHHHDGRSEGQLITVWSKCFRDLCSSQLVDVVSEGRLGDTAVQLIESWNAFLVVLASDMVQSRKLSSDQQAICVDSKTKFLIVIDIVAALENFVSVANELVFLSAVPLGALLASLCRSWPPEDWWTDRDDVAALVHALLSIVELCVESQTIPAAWTLLRDIVVVTNTVICTEFSFGTVLEERAVTRSALLRFCEVALKTKLLNSSASIELNEVRLATQRVAICGCSRMLLKAEKNQLFTTTEVISTTLLNNHQLEHFVDRVVLDTTASVSAATEELCNFLAVCSLHSEMGRLIVSSSFIGRLSSALHKQGIDSITEQTAALFKAIFRISASLLIGHRNEFLAQAVNFVIIHLNLIKRCLQLDMLSWTNGSTATFHSEPLFSLLCDLVVFIEVLFAPQSLERLDASIPNQCREIRFALADFVQIICELMLHPKLFEKFGIKYPTKQIHQLLVRMLVGTLKAIYTGCCPLSVCLDQSAGQPADAWIIYFQPSCAMQTPFADKLLGSREQRLQTNWYGNPTFGTLLSVLSICIRILHKVEPKALSPSRSPKPSSISTPMELFWPHSDQPSAICKRDVEALIDGCLSVLITQASSLLNSLQQFASKSAADQSILVKFSRELSSELFAVLSSVGRFYGGGGRLDPVRSASSVSAGSLSAMRSRSAGRDELMAKKYVFSLREAFWLRCAEELCAKLIAVNESC